MNPACGGYFVVETTYNGLGLGCQCVAKGSVCSMTPSTTKTLCQISLFDAEEVMGIPTRPDGLPDIPPNYPVDGENMGWFNFVPPPAATNTQTGTGTETATGTGTATG